MKVKNINGRRQNSCSCGSWLDHWVKVSGWPLPDHCAVSTCMCKPQLGAHVQKDDPSDTSWYIVPLCVKHSIRAASLEIADTTTLVSAHVSETCGQRMPIGNVWPHDLRDALKTGSIGHDLEMAALNALDRAKSAGLYGRRKTARHEPPVLLAIY